MPLLLFIKMSAVFVVPDLYRLRSDHILHVAGKLLPTFVLLYICNVQHCYLYLYQERESGSWWAEKTGSTIERQAECSIDLIPDEEYLVISSKIPTAGQVCCFFFCRSIIIVLTFLIELGLLLCIC